jgi:hypothetical protein
MIRKLRTERDNQQWMLDLALNMRGRVKTSTRHTGRQRASHLLVPIVPR